MGQLKKDKITLVQTVKDVEKLSFSSQEKIAYTTQTTLSIYETKNIIDALKTKFPHIQAPLKEIFVMQQLTDKKLS